MEGQTPPGKLEPPPGKEDPLPGKAKPPSGKETTGYGLQVGGTHHTGMHTCAFEGIKDFKSINKFPFICVILLFS